MLYEFSYEAPTRMDELLDLLAERGERARVFSGGTDLFVSLRSGLLQPDYVVNLKGVPELSRIEFDPEVGLSIGACTTVNQLLDHEAVRSHYRILRVAGQELATFQLRNRATVAGNIVTASPCGDMSSPLLCLGAQVRLVSVRGERSLPLHDFITGVKQTRIEPDEIVRSILVPTDHIDASGGYQKLKRIKGHDLGVVSVALIKAHGAARVAISSAAPTPVLLPEFKASTPIEEVQHVAQEAISPIDDVRCTKEYRAFMVDVFIRRLMEEVAA